MVVQFFFTGARWIEGQGSAEGHQRRLRQQAIFDRCMEICRNIPRNVTLWLFIDGLPIKNGDFPWLC